MQFPGQSEDGNRMEVMELKSHPYYVGVQYHPEYLSRPYKPSAPFLGFVLASCNKLKPYLDRLPTAKALSANHQKFYLNPDIDSSATLNGHLNDSS